MTDIGDKIMKIFKRIILILCICLVLQMQVSANLVAQAPVTDKSITNGCNGVDAQVPFLGTEQLITNASAVVLLENNSQTLMYAWNADARLHPASLVKILTALIAVEKGNPEDLVTVRQDVLDTVPSDAVSAELKPSELLTLKDLLYCMMVSSANDAAAVIADHISGSQTAFVQEMNQYAQQLGCTGTQFMNVHGLHHPEQYTTARDTARILGVAMKNEQFREIFGTVRYTVEATNRSPSRKLATGNYLMNADEVEIYYDTRVIGGRTGTTNDGDKCIAAAAEQNGLQMISVVMGAKSVYEQDGIKVRSFGGFPETTQLLDHGFGNYKINQVIYENQVIRQLAIPGGDCDLFLAPDISVASVIPSGTTLDQLSYIYYDKPNLQVPISKGQALSVVEVWLGNLCLAQADLYAMNRVQAQQTETPVVVENPEKGAWPTVIMILALILGSVLLWVLVKRVIRRIRFASTKHKRHHRSDRRRRR